MRFDLRILKSAMLVFVFALASGPSHALEKILLSDIHPALEDTLKFSVLGNVRPGTKIGKFILGGWPSTAEEPRPVPETNLAIVRGQQENFEWANAFLLRVDPANFGWLTNGAIRGIDPKLNMGRDPILMSFEQPMCALGFEFAQGGAHNPHHPRLRKRTRFSMYDHSGNRIGHFDELPGYFTVEVAYQKTGLEPEILAVQIESDVPFALISIVAQPCAIVVGQAVWAATLRPVALPGSPS